MEIYQDKNKLSKEYLPVVSLSPARRRHRSPPLEGHLQLPLPPLPPSLPEVGSTIKKARLIFNPKCMWVKYSLTVLGGGGAGTGVVNTI